MKLMMGLFVFLFSMSAFARGESVIMEVTHATYICNDSDGDITCDDSVLEPAPVEIEMLQLGDLIQHGVATSETQYGQYVFTTELSAWKTENACLELTVTAADTQNSANTFTQNFGKICAENFSDLNSFYATPKEFRQGSQTVGYTVGVKPKK